MSLRSKAVIIAIGAAIIATGAFAQCDDKTGFAKQLCEAQANAQRKCDRQRRYRRE